ncbi:hypothetical protein POSPLADRAFT_1041611 [Postia placenta MAD-698-R-SB12]|uniref:Uncharacterized protein n=1 Tax=Postia placenta MAD-698-R-SB12 TaxID=670580 RepID=A0A1X6MMT3_9APHY|nr:hypothetical protein POSPLADRAFT_1041611 [Postia placenta MAD-698-R-SB12]OSX57747.1 hypothetical protein POSPLADRAFT_1041611 [Postia placenta MAD-698-R-SB12]
MSSLSHHTLRQLKFILPGGLTTYYLNSHAIFWRVVRGDTGTDGWGRFVALAALGSALLTVTLFIYILSIPLLEGEQPNYRRWRESGTLSSVIPILTASIVVGWWLLTFTLSRWSGLGLIEGVVGASGLYALTFGLLGLVPSPRVSRQ